MPRSQPDAQTLLGVAVDYLEAEVYPKLQGAERYRTRVALNALRIVQRELTLGPAADREEAAQLRALAGAGATNEQLAAQIAGGERSLDDPQLVAYLRDSLQRALAVNNPRWTRDETKKKETP